MRVATLPSSVIADLKSTNGRPVRACLRNGWLSSRARVASSPSATSTAMPSSRRIPRPRPEAFSVGSSEATTTRAKPASRIASVHGGVRPVWQHGSSETYSVAPRRSAPPAAAIAARSACGSPSAVWKPSPSTRPSRTITAPTSGLGLVRPRPPSASSIARARCSASVAWSVLTYAQTILTRKSIPPRRPSVAGDRDLRAEEMRVGAGHDVAERLHPRGGLADPQAGASRARSRAGRR